MQSTCLHAVSFNLCFAIQKTITSLLFPKLLKLCLLIIPKDKLILSLWCLWTVVLEKTPESPLDSKEIKSVNLKGNQPWILIGRTDAETEAPVFLFTWCKQPTHWKRPWWWERLRAEGKEGVRGGEGWMASSMQWTWTWANFGRWWGKGRPVVLQSVGSKRVRHDWVTEQQQQCLYLWFFTFVEIQSFLWFTSTIVSLP